VSFKCCGLVLVGSKISLFGFTHEKRQCLGLNNGKVDTHTDLHTNIHKPEVQDCWKRYSKSAIQKPPATQHRYGTWLDTLVSMALTAASIVLCCLINSTARFGPIPRTESQ